MERELLLASLEQLEITWQLAGDRATSKLLQGGASDDEVESTWGDLAWSLPTEAVDWWGWHNGGQFGRGPGIGGSHFEFLTTRQARTEYNTLLDVAVSVAGRDAKDMTDADWYESAWHPAWIPIAMAVSGAALALDCRVLPEQPSPVRVVESFDLDRERVDADSLLDVVQGWLKLYESGFYRWDGTKWLPDFSKLPAHMRDLW